MTAIRPLRADEGPLLRELRLAALGDAPDAFGPTLESARAEPDEAWRRHARGFAESDAAELLVAENEDGRAVGLVSAVRTHREGRIGAMWVRPEARGKGVARRLLAAACESLEARGCARITLSVTETNARAIALYRDFGFEATGESHPLRPGSPLRELEMARVTAGSG